jgi:fructose-1,6-bisphosphatase II
MADHAAVEAMRKMLGSIQFDGTVVIGEGERDEAPMLYIGEKVGKGSGPRLDLALDPLEGTTICARGGNNALSVIAIAEEGHFLHAPDTYMSKIAVGPDARGAIDLNASPTENLQNIAKAKKKYVEDLTVIILDRPRHAAGIRAAHQGDTVVICADDVTGVYRRVMEEVRSRGGAAIADPGEFAVAEG